MNWESYLYPENEKPLDRLVEGYSNTSIFRKVAFVGDSMSSGEFETCDENGQHGWYDMYEYSWGQHIARQNGLTGYNFSAGGMTAKAFIEREGNKHGWWDKEKAAQAYIIAMGANDLVSAKMEIGSVEDIDPSDCTKNKPTFLGYYAAMVARYKELSPDAKFFFVTLPKIHLDWHNEIAEAHAAALYSLAEYYNNCYMVDLYKYAPVFDERFYSHFHMHGHMNPMGYLLVGKMIDSYIDYIIRHNPKDFEKIGFINTGIKC
ncbi:MAG: SGNH/GDSL hydrolase family protein [Clostridia bacterium]|nr:SGNH/GDSL hydrolase family protein [Clostridia bacterium]